MKKRLFIDMDGTLAKFHDADKTFIEAMWTPGFYTELKPFENAVEGIKKFIVAHPEVEVYILSAVLDTDPPFIVGEKNKWLDQYLPEVPANHRIFTRAGTNKAEYIGKISENDFLIDDYNKNLYEFQAAGATPIKFHNDVNMRGKGAFGGDVGPLWSGNIVHYDSEPDVFALDLAAMVCEGQIKNQDIDITLLTSDEFEKYKSNIPSTYDSWWLRTPGADSCSVACVLANGNVNTTDCFYDFIPQGVRPAVIFNDGSNVSVSDKLEIGGNVYTVLDTNYEGVGKALALCDKCVANTFFDLSSNAWETSQLKHWLENDFLPSINRHQAQLLSKTEPTSLADKIAAAQIAKPTVIRTNDTNNPPDR